MLIANLTGEVTMQTLPTAMIRVLAPFVPLFSDRVWRPAQVLLMGARSSLRAIALERPPCGWMGLGHIERFERYHRVLNRARWSGREAARVLSGLLVEAFDPDGEPRWS